MKICKIISLCMVVLVTLCGCGLFGDQKYVCDADNVKSIQIVRLDKYIEEEYRFDYTVLCEITDDSFVDRLNNVEHSVNWGEPSQQYPGYVVIKIDYNNGDCDWLYHNAQWFYRSGKSNYGFFFFNVEEFDALISDYWTE